MNTFIKIYGIAMLAIGIYLLVTALFNIRFFKKMLKGKPNGSKEKPLVSIIIPARDEEANLPRLLTSLTKQTYENYEVLIINDQSSDRTWDIIKEFESKDSRFHGYCTDPNVKLSKHGKMNALLQLIPHAKGEYFLATDADTEHAPNSIEVSIKMMLDNNLDIVSGFPIEYCPTYPTGITVAAMVFALTMVPHSFFYRFQWSKAAFAIGQFIMMKKDAYYDVGGYEAIDNEVVDDMGLVKAFVKKGKKYAFVNLSKSVGCYMYNNGLDAFKGIERSIMGLCPAKFSMILPLFCLVAVLLMIAWAPLAALIFCLLGYASTSLWLLLIGWALFTIGWYIGCRNIRFKKRVCSSSFLSITIICAMYVHGLYRRLSGKNFIWKGRVI